MAVDFVQQVDTLESYAKTFVVSPTQWATFRPPINLKWHGFPFSFANRAKAPKQGGVYAFVVRKNMPTLPHHGYIMYVGMTKSDGSGGLRTRYANYLVEKKVLKRPKVHYMLNKWKNDVYFYYATVISTRVDIPALEQSLCDALIPPCNINDFSAKIRHLVRAFM